MKSLRNRILAMAALGFGIFAASATPAAAQAAVYKGSFTLPVAAEWQSSKLPAGNYTFSIKSMNFPVQVRIEGEDGAVYASAVGLLQRNSGDQSFLVLEQRGDSKFVRELYLAQIGLHVRYYVPEEPKYEPLAKGPAKTERVAVLAASK
jgi:hypothetical protein